MVKNVKMCKYANVHIPYDSHTKEFAHLHICTFAHFQPIHHRFYTDFLNRFALYHETTVTIFFTDCFNDISLSPVWWQWKD